MKRYLLLIPVILFMILNACNQSSNVPPAMSTAVVKTLTAAVVTPSVTPTPMYSTERMLINGDLNTALESNEVSNKFEQLEHAIGDHYQVTNVKLLPENGPATDLEVDISCECPLNIHCCTRERAFVVTMMAMDRFQYEIRSPVPPTVIYLHVRCFDHDHLMGEISVSWDSVKNFLSDSTTSGYPFASDITREP